MAEKIPNQATVRDTQNFEIDINKIFKDFISEIESVRSIINISTPDNETKLKKLDEQTVSGLSSVLKVETYPQESRCHAFYRLVGFPIINKSKDKMYNPGLDLVKNVNKKSKKDKIAIANDTLEGFLKLSSARESYLNKIRDVFSTNKNINASVFALSSGTTIRKFSAPIEKSEDPFVFKKEDSQYVLDSTGMIGVGRAIKLDQYVDANSKTPSYTFRDGTSFKNRNHIILPFIVDPRIDFTVSPVKNLVAVPFVPTKSELKISEVDFVRRPLLEKIIRERFADTSEIGTANEDIITFVKNIDSIKDENIIKSVTKKDGTYKLTEQLQFFKYLNIIRAMSQKLVESQKVIEEAQSKYYWLPIPSPTGPEGNSDIYPVFVNVPDTFKSDRDNKIIQLKVQSVVNQ